MALFGKSKRGAEQRPAQEQAVHTGPYIDLARQEQAIIGQEQRLADLEAEIAAKREELVSLDDTLLMQECGLFEPTFEFANSTQYQDRLKIVRAQEKALVKGKKACTDNPNWVVGGDKKKGQRTIADLQKLMLRCFNAEADEAIRKVKHSNYEASRARMLKSAEQISKFGRTWKVCLTDSYVDLKLEELRLAFEFAMMKEREKEELRELKAREREDAKVRKEIEAQRKKLEKERQQYSKAANDVRKQLDGCPEDERADLEAKLAELTGNLEEVDKGIADVDYREANQRAGYVYVISNIGSFGEGVYKIGMTRRLDPMERVKELGDASVPFNFDVHAMIFTDDAPGLEAALHNRFSDRKVNLVNMRREFFRCSLDEIIQAVKENFDRTVEFTIVPDAEQYRTSETIRAGKAS